MISILLNGQPHQGSFRTVADLLESLTLHEQRLAVEINGDVIPRSTHHTVVLQANDRVEIVRAIGGG